MYTTLPSLIPSYFKTSRNPTQGLVSFHIYVCSVKTVYIAAAHNVLGFFVLRKSFSLKTERESIQY